MKLARLLILLFLSSSLFAQLVYPDKHYTTHDGLPQIQVMDMLQDSRGYIWVATKKGVARFNGEKFTKLDLPVQNVNHIYEDGKGRLHFFTTKKNGTVLQYDGQNFMPLTINKNFLNRSYLNKIKDDKLYVCTNSKEILVYDLDSFEQEESIFLQDTVHLISKLSDDRLVAFHRKHNILYDVINQEVVYQADESDYFNIKMNQRGQENILIRKPYSGGRKMSILANDLKKVTLSYDRKAPDYSELKNIELSKNKGLYYLTSKDKVVMVSGPKVINEYKVSNTTRVICMLDIDDNLWISHENGIEFFSKNHIAKAPIELISDAWSILPYDESFVCSSYSGGFSKISLENNTRQTLFSSRQDNLNYGASIDKAGNLYFPGNLFLHKYNKKQKFETYPLKPGNLSLVSFYDSVNDKVVVGGNKSIGILDQEKEKIYYTFDDTEKMVSRYVVSIEGKDDENYWVGTYRDLASFNHIEKSYSGYNHLFPQDSSGAICLAPDQKSDKVWIGNTKGLWCLDESQKELTAIGKEMFLGEYVMALLVLPNQMLAIGTSNGFSILNLREYNDNGNVIIKTFNHRNGFFGEEVAQSGLVLNGDILYIPSSTYLSYVDINKLTFEEDFSNLIISNINGNSLPWNNKEPIKLERGQNNISLSFEGLGFNKPHETRYSYYLESVDDRWSPWVTQDKVNYNNLGSGNYHFKVKSQTSNIGLSNINPEATIDFEIDLPFYKNANFYKYAAFTLLAFILLSFYLFWRYRRTRDVTIMQDQQIKYLEVQALQSQMNPHFIFNVLGTIQALILNKRTEEANKYLVSFSKLIRRFLDASVSSNIDRNNINKDNSVPLSSEIELINLYVEFELLQYKDKFDFEMAVESEDLLSIHLPPMIIQPFVENAIKHGLLNKEEKGKLKIDFYKTKHGVTCSIDDNGIGRKKAQLLHQQSISPYTSRGTELVFKRVNILNAMNQNIKIKTVDKTAPKSGTRVDITFSEKSLT